MALGWRTWGFRWGFYLPDSAAGLTGETEGGALNPYSEVPSPPPLPRTLLPKRAVAKGSGGMVVPRMGRPMHTCCPSSPSRPSPASLLPLPLPPSSLPREQASDDSGRQPLSHTTDVKWNRGEQCPLGPAHTAGFCKRNTSCHCSVPPWGLTCSAASGNPTTAVPA